MTMQTPAPSGSSTHWGTAMEYFAPPLVIPVAVGHRQLVGGRDAGRRSVTRNAWWTE